MHFHTHYPQNQQILLNPNLAFHYQQFISVLSTFYFHIFFYYFYYYFYFLYNMLRAQVNRLNCTSSTFAYFSPICVFYCVQHCSQPKSQKLSIDISYEGICLKSNNLRVCCSHRQSFVSKCAGLCACPA